MIRMEVIFPLLLFCLLNAGGIKSLDVGNDVASQITKEILAILGNQIKNREMRCDACDFLFDGIIRRLDSGEMSYQDVEDLLVAACYQLPHDSDHICEEFFALAMPGLEYVFTNTPNITGNDVCGTIFVFRGCTFKDPDRYWEVEWPIVPDKPIVTEPDYDNNFPTLKVLHLTDTHYDPDYVIGSNAYCPDTVFCCRNTSDPFPDEDKAGFWGDYLCDAPKWLLELMYQHIADTHPDVDFIIWTGDLVPHDMWDTSKPSNLDTIRTTVELVKQYFPNTPVFPAVGNHEGHPANTFPQPYVDDIQFDISWLYDQLQEVWSDWLPESTYEHIRYGGYYATMIKDDLKIISVNSNYCYGFNWWLIMDDNDVAEVLKFMIEELQKSEDNGEKVYIISHHPSGNRDCAMQWSHEYNKIIERYEDTITGIFYGHTHKDHFTLFLDDDDRPYEIGYIAQSQTPLPRMNPGYKIYDIENGSYYRVLDHQNWMLDLELANSMNVTTFFRLYSAREEYNLENLSPQSWYNLVMEMKEEGSLYFDHFYRNHVKGSKPLVEAGCDQMCKDEIICQLLLSDNSERESRCGNVAFT